MRGETIVALGTSAEMKALAAKSGFELVNVGVGSGMDAFMKEKAALYMESAKLLGLTK